jgi:hypothetical protein
VLMITVSKAFNVPSDVKAQGSSTAAWLGMAQRQNRTVQALVIHRIDTLFPL